LTVKLLAWMALCAALVPLGWAITGDDGYAALSVGWHCASLNEAKAKFAETWRKWLAGMSAPGPSRHFAAAQQFSRFRSEADIQRDANTESDYEYAP
jgi:hypothetical protein